ncbi:MAG: XRE family transcriptional regulator [Bacteroides stercoris]
MSVKNEDGQYPYLMIGEELRYLLKASGVSLKMIADHAGMSNSSPFRPFKRGDENQRAHTLV